MRGVGGEVILPGDIAGVLPWCPVEVKFDVAAAKPGRTWDGDAFARRTIKRLLTEWRAKPSGTLWYPVLMVRLGSSGVKMPERWRIYVPEAVLLYAVVGARVPRWENSWVQLPASVFFAEVAHAVPGA